MAILVLCLKPVNLLDPNPAFVSFGNRLTISPVVERLVFSKARPAAPSHPAVLWSPAGAGAIAGNSQRSRGPRSCILNAASSSQPHPGPAAFWPFTLCDIIGRPVRLQVPEAVADWVEDMASSWDFQRIIPCHMAAPIQATPNDLRRGPALGLACSTQQNDSLS